MVAALNKIVVNTYMTALNVSKIPNQGGGGLGVLAGGGWITGGIPGRDSVPLASGTAIGMPGEFVVRHDIAQMNRSWLPDFNATGRLPSPVSLPSFRAAGNDNGGQAALIAEIRALRAELAEVKKTVAAGSNVIAQTTYEAGEKGANATEKSGKALRDEMRMRRRDQRAANG